MVVGRGSRVVVVVGTVFVIVGIRVKVSGVGGKG